MSEANYNRERLAASAIVRQLGSVRPTLGCSPLCIRRFRCDQRVVGTAHLTLLPHVDRVSRDDSGKELLPFFEILDEQARWSARPAVVPVLNDQYTIFERGFHTPCDLRGGQMRPGAPIVGFNNERGHLEVAAA